MIGSGRVQSAHGCSHSSTLCVEKVDKARFLVRLDTGGNLGRRDDYRNGEVYHVKSNGSCLLSLHWIFRKERVAREGLGRILPKYEEQERVLYLINVFNDGE